MHNSIACAAACTAILALLDDYATAWTARTPFFTSCPSDPRFSTPQTSHRA